MHVVVHLFYLSCIQWPIYAVSSSIQGVEGRARRENGSPDEDTVGDSDSDDGEDGDSLPGEADRDCSGGNGGNAVAGGSQPGTPGKPGK